MKKSKMKWLFFKRFKKLKYKEEKKNNWNYSEPPVPRTATETLIGAEEKTVEREVEEMERHKAEEGPFTIIGTKGSYNICIGNDVCHPEKFETVREANETIKKKDWDLILIAGIVYNEKVQAYKKTLNNGN